MGRSILRAPEPRRLAAGLALAAVAFCCRASSGYTPSSPEVRQAVDRAVKYLETGARGGYQDSRPGAWAVAGIALFKNGAPPRHPFIVSTANLLCQKIDDAEEPSKLGFDIYSASLSIMFLVQLDKDRFRPEVDFLLRYLQSQQKAEGGWGYADTIRKTCDTSMTQNAVLAFWEASKAKVPIDMQMVDRALVWLLKTQDPSGAFGYQGRVSPDFTPVPQSEIRPSMAGAGLGSIYVCADLLNVGRPEARPKRELPPGVREIQEEKEQRPGRSRVDPRLVEQALARGKAWMERNFEIEHPVVKHTLYNLYTVERYHTFREIAEGNVEPEPRWYTEGARYLLQKQRDDGAWEDGSGTMAATAFGVLFLVRSTKISVTGVREFGDGTLVGGRGLPKITGPVAVVNGAVVAKPELGALDKILASLNEADSPEAADAAAALAELPTEEATKLVAKHARLLEKLAGGDSPEARLAAVRAMGKNRNLDHVPLLIHALNDENLEVALAARDSLRRISRKFQGFGMPDEPTPLERHTAIRKWQAWYLAIRPDAVLED